METLNPAFVGGPENGTGTQWILWKSLTSIYFKPSICWGPENGSATQWILWKSQYIDQHIL
jgi:hypothetical protein